MTEDYTSFFTYSTVQSPSWEANLFAANQEIPRISRNTKVHYRTHKRPPPVSILGQPNPVLIPTSHLLEIHPKIIHSSTPRSPQLSLPLRFPHQDPIHIPLSSPIRATCPAHLILLHFITRTIFGEQYQSFCSSLCNLLHSPVTSSLLVPNILLNAICYYLEEILVASRRHSKNIPGFSSSSKCFFKNNKIRNPGNFRFNILSIIGDICAQTYLDIVPNSHPPYVALRATYPAAPKLTSIFTPNRSLPDVITNSLLISSCLTT